MIHEVVRSFAIIAINYSNKAILSSGHSLPASTYEPAISLMNQMHDVLKSRLLWHFIDSFTTAVSSWTYFQQFIERNPSAPTFQRSAIVFRVNTTRSNAPRGNSGRVNQRDNSTIIPTIVSNETGWIRMSGRSSSCRLPFIVGGVQLCKDHTIIGRVCAHKGRSFPKIIHITILQFPQTDNETVSHWISNGHTISWPGLNQDNHKTYYPLIPS